MSSTGIRTLVTGGTGFLGINLVHALRSSGREILIVSRKPPEQSELVPSFAAADILDSAKLETVFRHFAPREVVHLAAKTDFVNWDDPEGFRVNTKGTENVIKACHRTGVRRLIVASSHVVLRPEQNGQSDLNYASSKLAMESIVKRTDASSLTWTIVRPCSIWGPWFRAPFLGFFKSIAKGRYFDLGNVDPPKRLGFVGNTCHQMQQLLELPTEKVHGRTLYLADYETTTIRTWSRLIAAELGIRPPRAVPELIVRTGARVGDVLQTCGYKNPPLTSFRLANMRTDTSLIPIDEIKSLVDPLPFSLPQGVKMTVDWLRETGAVN